jgi:peptidyl-prolyl cis-trans isomerase D
MIRILQQDTKATKILFGIIIGAAIVSMVVYLIPGLLNDNTTQDASGVYATVHPPGVWGRIFGPDTSVKTDQVTRTARRMLMQQRIPESMAQQLMPMVLQRAGNISIEQAILQQEADRLHLQVSDEDLRNFLRTGPFAPYLFPNGQYVGDDGYINFINQMIDPQLSRTDFEKQLKQDLELQRLQALVTGAVTVPDRAVREAYRQAGTKVKFDYAVVSAEDLKKTINPSDADLQAFFKQNSARYANAIPETRKIQYVAFTAANLPGGKPQVTDGEIQAYYNSHVAEYKTEEQVKTRHILITSRAGADAQTDNAAKAKAQDVLKQLQAGGTFADLAKKYSEDPGSKDQGGELPLVPTAGLDPAYAKAAMALNPGQTSGLVKSQFGYHIIQTEQKQPAGTKPLTEVKDSIVQVLQQQKAGQAEQQLANQLAEDAKKNGIEKAAAAHGLHAVTTDYVAHDGVIGGLSDASTLLNQAFSAGKGAAPATASTGDGFAIFQVLDVRPAHAPEFAEYKSHILEDYRNERAPRLVQDQLRKLDDRAKVLNDLQKAAAELKIPVKSSDLVGQDGQVPDLGAMTGGASVAFSLPKGGVSGPISTADGGAVLSVTDKQEPSADDLAKNFDRMRDQLLSEQRDQMFNVFVGTLAKRYEDGKGIRLSKQAAQQPAS